MSESSEGRPISRREAIKRGAAWVAGVALAGEGLRRATNSQQEASTPKPEPETIARDENPQVSEMYMGTVNIETIEKTDPQTNGEERLKIRTAPFRSKSAMVDNRKVVVTSTAVDWDSINSINGVNIKGHDSFNIENPLIVPGQDVDPLSPNGDRWIEVDAVINDRFGRDDKKKLYINFGTMTSLFVHGEPDPNAPTEDGFIKAQKVDDSVQILDQGDFWKPFGNEVNTVSFPPEQGSQE